MLLWQEAYKNTSATCGLITPFSQGHSLELKYTYWVAINLQ